MPTGTEPLDGPAAWSRRVLMKRALSQLGWGAASGLLAAASGSALANTRHSEREGRRPVLHFATAWRGPQGAYEVGVLAWRAGQPLSVKARVAVPTRAHAVVVDPHGALLAVARRPGEWMMRLNRQGQVLQKIWIEPDRSFNGHVGFSADGRHLCTSETDLNDGQGLLGVRDARTLQKRAEWRTHGMDPHALLRDAQGHWMVANGGIPTLPETGRVKLDLHRMEASLVRLHRDDGRLLGQWRLDDPRLSLRHLAWGAQGRLGVALQAEHDDESVRQQAPVLAWFDGQGLQLAPQPMPLSGYGGDVASLGTGWAVSCPRSNRVALWQDGQWVGTQDLASACALAAGGQSLWMGGAQSVRGAHGVSAADESSWVGDVDGLTLDNHWVVLNAAA